MKKRQTNQINFQKEQSMFFKTKLIGFCKSLVILLVAFALSTTSNGQNCTVNGIDGGSTQVTRSSGQIGQTFIPCQDGEITEIIVSLITNANYTFFLEEHTPGGQILNLTNQILTQSVTTATSTGTPVTFTLPTPYSVNSGSTYRFTWTTDFIGSWGCRATTGGSDYPDGGFTGGSSFISDWDLDFELTIQPPTPLIPTMGEWALITLALIILSMGVIYVMQWQKKIILSPVSTSI